MVVETIIIGMLAFVGSILFSLERPPLLIKVITSTGLPFFFIGVVLGPLFLNLIDEQAIMNFDVFVQLTVGWVGLLFGMQLNYRDLRRIGVHVNVAALAESLLTFLLLSVALFIVMNISHDNMDLLFMLIFASIAALSSPAVNAVIFNEISPRGPISNSIRQLIALDPFVSIVLAGIIICFFPIRYSFIGYISDGMLWFAISIGIGLILGIVAHILTLYRYDTNQLLVVILGLVIFYGGLAHYLKLSPLFVNLLVGIVLANVSPHRHNLMKSLMLVEKPLFLILMVIVGAMWQLPSSYMWLLVFVFALGRIIAKIIGGLLGGIIQKQSFLDSLLVGIGITPHGGIALAITLNVAYLLPRHQSNLVITAVIMSILLSSLIGPRLVKYSLSKESR